jgi:hypothetical protein
MKNEYRLQVFGPPPRPDAAYAVERRRAEQQAAIERRARRDLDRLLATRADNSDRCPYCQSGNLYAARPADPMHRVWHSADQRRRSHRPRQILRTPIGTRPS